MRRFLAAALLIISGCAHGADGRSGTSSSQQVRNIVLLIVDGAGSSMWSAAAYATDEPLSVSRMPVGGQVDTRSASSRVTDSAAGATTYATGIRVTNRTISVGGDCPLPSSRDTIAGPWPTGCDRIDTWFALARSKGRSAGVVTTTAVIDATPASFVAHAPSRYWRQYIAEQFAEANLDVLMGGGRAWFDGRTRSDSRDLLGDMCARADCLNDAAALTDYSPSARPVVGLFTPADMDADSIRAVRLPDMVRAALDKLATNPRGFVAMFESEAIDNAAHANLPFERIAADMLEFDAAVGVALDFAARTPGTLVIVTSDHDTGGFSLAERGDDFEVRYTTRGHTAGAVPIFASGPQAERFGGWQQNTEIGRLLMQIVNDWN